MQADPQRVSDDPKEIIKRALEREPGVKSLCPPSNLRTQLLVWVLSFLGRRGKRDLCQQYLGCWLGWFHRGLENCWLGGPRELGDRNRCGCICLRGTDQRSEVSGLHSLATQGQTHSRLSDVPAWEGHSLWASRSSFSAESLWLGGMMPDPAPLAFLAPEHLALPCPPSSGRGPDRGPQGENS